MRKQIVWLALLGLLVAVTATAALAQGAAPDQTRAAPGWQQLFPPASPPPRASHAMAYDTDRGVAVLFGGYLDGEIGDTWEWDSATMTWSQRFPAHSPSPRYGHAMVYDEARGATMLFGGTEGFFLNNETWLWDGMDWTQHFPASAPSARWLHGMVYDAQRQVVVLFGGLEGAPAQKDTWEWDGTDWTLIGAQGPSGRCCMGMAYDRGRRTTVLFGGGDIFPYAKDDSWERQGGGPWVELFPANSPSGRERPAMAYFPPRKSVVLFGGEDFTFYGDTFLWENGEWLTRPFSPSPAARCCTGLVYDPVLKGLLLFGGSLSGEESNDTWLFK
jgi:hypothetical protein